MNVEASYAWQGEATFQRYFYLVLTISHSIPVLYVFEHILMLHA